MQIIATIIPIFIVVMLGWAVHRRGFIPEEFLGPANRLVFYVAIPAMIFQSIAKSTLHEWFNPVMIAATLAAAATGYCCAWFACRVVRIHGAKAGTFIQSAGHGNLGYIGLAVAFYFLGPTGLVHASVVAGFLMILQNLLSVSALQSFAMPADRAHRRFEFAAKVLANPVILAVMVGMLFSALQLQVPLILERSLTIVGGLALPTALLIIGASLSNERIRAHKWFVLAAAAIKLLALPFLGWMLYRLCGLRAAEFLPGLILLASPTATITYVMAKEMRGDADLAVATVSASTLTSALTFVLWLHLATS